MFQQLLCTPLLYYFLFILHDFANGSAYFAKKEMLSKRYKRSFLNLFTAMQCNLPEVLLQGSFGDYGCYCGFSGEGEPLDEIDRCCHTHDLCYEKADASTSFWESIVTHPLLHNYETKCQNRTIICAKNSPYGDKLCQCDKTFGNCLQRSYPTHNRALYSIDTSKYCKEGANATELLKTQTTKPNPAKDNPSNATSVTSNQNIPGTTSAITNTQVNSGESGGNITELTMLLKKPTQLYTQPDIFPPTSSMSSSTTLTILYTTNKHVQNQPMYTDGESKSDEFESTELSDEEDTIISSQSPASHSSVDESVSVIYTGQNNANSIAVSVFLHLKRKCYSSLITILFLYKCFSLL